MKAQQYRLDIRFDDKLLDAGFTAIPNLLLQHYKDLGLSDAELTWVIHLLRFKWSKAAPYPKQKNIPMACSEETKRRYAHHLREAGLLFTRRIYHTAETAPRSGLVGRIRSLEYYLDSLFHNVIRVSEHLSAGKPLSEFIVELPHNIVQKVATNFYHDVPDDIQSACEQHIISQDAGPLLLAPTPTNCSSSSTPTNCSSSPTPTNCSSSSTPTKASARKTGSHKEDSIIKRKETKEEKEEEASRKEDSVLTPTSRQLLSEFGINEPVLSEISEIAAPHAIRGWLMYLKTQRFEGKQGYLINQLRRNQSPPSPYQRLGKITDAQITVLEMLANDRRWTSMWDQDKLAEANIEEKTAEFWYQEYYAKTAT